MVIKISKMAHFLYFELMNAETLWESVSASERSCLTRLEKGLSSCDLPLARWQPLTMRTSVFFTDSAVY